MTRRRENFTRDKVDEQVGKRFSRLLVVNVRTYNGIRSTMECQCDCGKTCTVKLEHLLYGQTKSCGCLSVEKTKQRLQNIEDGRREFIKENFVGGTQLNAFENIKSLVNNTGRRGVSQRSDGKFRARGVYRRKAYSLGVHDTFEEAVKAREEFETWVKSENDKLMAEKDRAREDEVKSWQGD